MFLGLIAWVVIGVVVGFIFSKAIDLRGDDPRFGVAAAAAGSIVAALLYRLIGGTPVSAFNVWGLIWAAIGAVIGAAVWHAVRSRSISHAGYTVRRSY